MLIVWCWIVLLWVTVPVRAVAVHVSPLVSRAPATIHIRVTVEPVADQRVLRVDAIGEDYQRGSELPLAGLDGPRTSFLDYRDIPAGHYELVAKVATSSRVVATASQSFLVAGLETP